MTAPMPTLFIDRDGTLIEEPADEQVDRFDKLRFMPGVVPALIALRDAGYRFVMITNQDGLGTERFPEEHFRGPHGLMMQLFESQGIRFEAVLICPHFPGDSCDCRKPATRLVEEYASAQPFDPRRSYVIGDRATDLELAVRLGIPGLQVLRDGGPEATWDAIARCLTAPAPRRAEIIRVTKETRITVSVDLDRELPVEISTGIGFFDHMLEQVARHGGFSLQLACQGDLQVDEHHTVEDCALALGEALRKALGDKRGIARFGFLLPMDEAQAQVAIDLSGRPYAVFEGRFGREQVGGLPTELVPHFFRSLGEALGAAIHLSVRGENTHHMVEACFKGTGRALRQAFRIEGRELPSSKGVL
ncbi:MAG: bifunctional histidinol-phosphatase/imidazoleglycerol-phosphate dehydratase HisB [Steroidobacteraceae bacterium]|jgi:imidazoleglycerol-phosphate dehydratase/histidinol-phosphatase|nr:bifunctional histidinol-phosphatase/imidazoleglycerol-phosphate dehydratase HisB [Steroidobacteraceae bacterium]